MSQQELLSFVSKALSGLGIDYFITGSWSSSFYGLPRSTHDLDIVVALEADQVDRLLAAFPSEKFYVSPQAVQQALRDRTMFNVLDTTSGDKIDFWMLTEQPWDRMRFSRRRTERLFGNETSVSSPEDTVLAKLLWCKQSGGSEKQMSDARGVYEVQSESLDLTYIEHWAQQLGLTDLWNELLTEPSH